MERGIILNDGHDHQARVRAGLLWLREKGGGTVLIPLWKDYETYFGEKREKHQRRLEAEGIRVEKMGRYMHPRGNVLVLYPDKDQMEAIESSERDGDTMVVEWAPSWLDGWRSAYEVAEYTVGDKD